MITSKLVEWCMRWSAGRATTQTWRVSQRRSLWRTRTRRILSLSQPARGRGAARCPHAGRSALPSRAPSKREHVIQLGHVQVKKFVHCAAGGRETHASGFSAGWWHRANHPGQRRRRAAAHGRSLDSAAARLPVWQQPGQPGPAIGNPHIETYALEPESQRTQTHELILLEAIAKLSGSDGVLQHVFLIIQWTPSDAAD